MTIFNPARIQKLHFWVIVHSSGQHRNGGRNTSTARNKTDSQGFDEILPIAPLIRLLDDPVGGTGTVRDVEVEMTIG